MRVLIVEDDPACAKLIDVYLSAVSEERIITSTYKEAMREIEMQPPTKIDLITLDLALPDSLTSETLASIRRIKEIRPNSLLIVITGRVHPGFESQIICAGADGYMYKPHHVANPSSFWKQLLDIMKSIARCPERCYQNLDIAETVVKRVVSHFS